MGVSRRPAELGLFPPLTPPGCPDSGVWTQPGQSPCLPPSPTTTALQQENGQLSPSKPTGTPLP